MESIVKIGRKFKLAALVSPDTEVLWDNPNNSMNRDLMNDAVTSANKSGVANLVLIAASDELYKVRITGVIYHAESKDKIKDRLTLNWREFSRLGRPTYLIENASYRPLKR